MIDQAHTYSQLGTLVAQMSLAVYQGQTGEMTEDEVWHAMGQGCSDIADLAEVIATEHEAEA